MTLIFYCVDCDKEADTRCFQCRGPWCKDCEKAMKSKRYDDHPCYTCRNSPDW